MQSEFDNLIVLYSGSILKESIFRRNWETILKILVALVNIPTVITIVTIFYKFKTSYICIYI